VTDTELVEAIANYLHGTKWNDVFEELRPRDIGDDEPLERYIDKRTFADHMRVMLRRRGYAP
jgi:hypothetical protein